MKAYVFTDDDLVTRVLIGPEVDWDRQAFRSRAEEIRLRDHPNSLERYRWYIYADMVEEFLKANGCVEIAREQI